ncbi:AMIN-like domain-containing (lipo)protein [Modestobacter lapidis]|nr:hypothetical protein [Modestobacter lapidis]
MHSRRRPAALVTATLVLSATGLLAGCGQQTGTDEAASTGSAPATVVESSDAGGTSAPAAGTSGAEASGGGGQPFPGDTSPDTAEPVDADGLTVTDVRIGAHDGFDRVVLDVGGQGTPGWDVQYVDAATSQGRGDPVDLAGPAYLRVILTGVTYPYESGLEERARGAVTSPDTNAVTGAWYDGTFEGQALVYVGTSAEQPFRVYALDDRSRVVIEVATG